MTVTTVGLDRPPDGRVEQELVNGFQEIDDLEEIWVREVNTHLTGSWPLLRVYLAFSRMSQEGRHKADRIQEAYEVRHTDTKMEFKFVHIPQGNIPADLPARIWKRAPKLWTPVSRS